MNKSTLFLLMASATVLASCGGDSGSTEVSGGTAPPAPTTVVPDVASTSVSAMVSYLVTLVSVKNDNTDSPVDVTNYAPPVTNVTEPDPLPTLQTQ